MDKERTFVGSNAFLEDQKNSYSTRKRRSAPRRYSPTPSWNGDTALKRAIKESLESARIPPVASFADSQKKPSGTRKKVHTPQRLSPIPLIHNEANNSKQTKPAVSNENKKKASARKTLKPGSSSRAPKRFQSAQRVEDKGPSTTNNFYPKQNVSVSSRDRRKKENKVKRRRYTHPNHYKPTYKSCYRSRAHSPTPPIDDRPSISEEQWAELFRRIPVVELVRYIPPSAQKRAPSPVPLLPPVSLESGTDSEREDSDNESDCCTPTPSWMDEDEIAGALSENGFQTGTRSATPSSGLLDESSHSSLNEITDFKIEEDGLEDKWMGEPIPTKENSLDICKFTPSLDSTPSAVTNGWDPDRSCFVPPLKSVIKVEENEFSPTVSSVDTGFAATRAIGLDFVEPTAVLEKYHLGMVADTCPIKISNVVSLGTDNCPFSQNDTEAVPVLKIEPEDLDEAPDDFVKPFREDDLKGICKEQNPVSPCPPCVTENNPQKPELKPDLTAEDVFEILFGPKVRHAAPSTTEPPCPIKPPPEEDSHPSQELDDLVSGPETIPLAKEDDDDDDDSSREAETELPRRPSSQSDDDLPPTEKANSFFSPCDVFEIVCGTRAFSPSLISHDSFHTTQEGDQGQDLDGGNETDNSESCSTLVHDESSPRRRTMSDGHPPTSALNNSSSPGKANGTPSILKRSISTPALSNGNDDTQKENVAKPKKRCTLSLRSRRNGYATRKMRFAPKRYSPTPPYYDETTNSSVENSYYYSRDKKHYLTRSRRSAPKRYSPTPTPLENGSNNGKGQSSKKVTGTGNGLVRRVSNTALKSKTSQSGSSEKDLELIADDTEWWGKFHGPSCTKQCSTLTIIRDSPAPRDEDDLSRAKKTAPPIVSVADSKIPNAGSGVWASEPIPARTRFGPYEGKIVPAKVFTRYAWLIRRNGKPVRCVDATEPGLSNWMRFVNCARHDDEQNLEAFQCHGNIYYKTTRKIAPHEELLVWYGDEYGRQLGIEPNVCEKEDEQNYKERSFKCPGCPFAFSSPLYLASHERVCRFSKAKDNGGFKLSEDLSRSSRQSVASPSPSEKQDLEWDIEDTDSALNSNDSLKSFSGPMQLEAPSEYRLSSVWNRFSVNNTFQDGKNFYCSKCKIAFRGRYYYNRHMQTKKHGGQTPQTCPECNKWFPSQTSLMKHMTIHPDKKLYTCPECSRRFHDRGNFKKHLDNHKGKKRFYCAKCNVSFSDKGILTKHRVQKHSTGMNLFVCFTCKKRYCDKQSLRRHQRIHNGEKPFVCYVCNKRFARREVFKTHLKVHRIGSQ